MLHRQNDRKTTGFKFVRNKNWDQQQKHPAFHKSTPPKKEAFLQKDY